MEISSTLQLTSLPKISLIRIGSLLRVKDLIAMRCVCQVFRQTYSDDTSFWKKMVDPNHPWNEELRKRAFCQICAQKWAETKKEDETWCGAIVDFILKSPRPNPLETLKSLDRCLPRHSWSCTDGYACYVYVPHEMEFRADRGIGNPVIEHLKPETFSHDVDFFLTGLHIVESLMKEKLASFHNQAKQNFVFRQLKDLIKEIKTYETTLDKAAKHAEDIRVNNFYSKMLPIIKEMKSIREPLEKRKKEEKERELGMWVYYI